MKRYLLLLAFAAVCFASCNKEDQNVPEETALNKHEAPSIIYAKTETNTQTGTKTYWGDNLKVLWNANDRISLFNQNMYNIEYKFVGTPGTSEGIFQKVGEDQGSQQFDKVFAIYPYSEDNEVDKSGADIFLTLPATQTYCENSFGPGANYMLAVRGAITNEDSNFEFKNVCGYLRLKLYGDDVTVKSITIEGNNNELIAGPASISAETLVTGSAPVVEVMTSGTSSITINCPNPVTLGTTASEATEFNFVIPPVTFTNGFKITVNGTSGGVAGKFVKSTSSNVAITRNVRRSMAALSVALEPLKYVEFEDDTFKAYCLANFDTDGDGKISEDEALAVTVMNCFNASPTHEYTYYYSGSDRYDLIYASSLKGIEEFKNLQILNVSGSTSVQGPLASLDLRQNTALKLLVVNYNDISSLNIEGLTQLEGLESCYTKLSEIDAYGLSKLEYLNSTNNTLLKEINLSQCTSFTTLDIENTLALERFECANTKLTKLNLSCQPHLSYVNCSNCSELEELDLGESKVSNSITWANCPAIKKFLFRNAKLETWPAEDFAGFSYIEEVDLNGSNYKGILDLSDKGHLKKLDAGNNQYLTGITVAERAPIEDFECANSGVTSLDIERLSLLNNFNCADCEKLESLTVKNCKISNSVAWTGCDKLKTLNLYGTEIISWPAGDFNVFPPLENLNISYTNYPNALDMNCNGGLKSLECEKVGISSINVSGLPELVFINCSKNSGLTSLDLSGLARLKELDCRECSISTLDIHYCSLLNALKAWPQSEGYSLHQVVLTLAQSDNIDNGTLKLYDTDGVMTEAQMYERYHTTFSNNY